MTRIRLDLRYDGSGYSGWQKQRSLKQKTIQGELDATLKDLTGETIITVGSGRTDAGTHARQQVVHFEYSGPANKYPWVNAINSRLPEQIQVYSCYEAPAQFHALLSCQHKHYIYYVHNSELPPVFRRNYCWWQRLPLDIDWLNEFCSHLLGTHDFKSFQNTGTDVHSTIRSLNRAEWVKSGVNTLEFHIEGDGFLKQMVRNIVGTCIDMHRAGAQTVDILKVLHSCRREMAGQTAPATGLFLNSVSYPLELDNKCRKL